MSQLARISRGVRAALRNLPSTFLNEKSNPWKVSPSYLNPNGITNPRPPFLPSSLPYATSTDKDGVTSEGEGKDDEPHNRLIDDLEVLSKILSVLKLFSLDGVTSEGKGKDDEPHNRLMDDLEVPLKILSVLKLFRLLRMHFQNNLQGGSTRTRIKVFQHGNPFGRSVNLTNYNGYDELITKLDEMFEFNGELISPNKSLLAVYMDNEGDKIFVGEDPWEEFCNVVRKIYIYTRDEVEEMSR